MNIHSWTANEYKHELLGKETNVIALLSKSYDLHFNSAMDRLNWVLIQMDLEDILCDNDAIAKETILYFAKLKR